MATTTWDQKAGMTSPTDVDNLESYTEQAEAAKDAAAVSEAAAAASAAAAALSETEAESAEANAATSATTAATGAATATTKASEAAASAASASTSATDAQTAQTAAEAAETAASASETASAASAAAASTSETNAASSASAASTSETNAATSEANAASSASASATSATAAQAAQTAAELAETNAETAETNAETAETNAAASATASLASETAAAASETNAAASETAASASEVNAAASEAAASASETKAATSETNAATSAASSATSATASASSATASAASASAASASETAAAASETAAAASEAAAATSEANASASETAAAASETAAGSSASSASTSAANAASSASAASTSETNAAASEAAAATSEANAATSEANAATSASASAASATASAGSATASASSASAAAASETAAATSEGNAATSASNAATSATNAATSETNASTSATAAASSASSASASADAALAALDSFDDRYLGQKASDPTVDNDGNALTSGALYFNTTDDIMKVYDGAAWLAAYASLSGALLATNNLSDVLDAATARTNLGLGTAATTASTDYATSAQGALADSAVQPNDSPSFGSVTVSGTVDGRDVAADGSKLDGIEAGATADQTAGEIKTAYESNANTNAYTDAEKSKLAGIEAGANVTDTANVTAAGALMDSEVTNLAQVKAFDSSDYATAAQGSLADSALQSGDNVSALINDAGYTTNVGDITGVTAGSGITGGGTSGTVTINHADTSSQGSINSSGGTVIQDITLDTYGHTTGLGTVNLDARYPNAEQAELSNPNSTAASLRRVAPNASNPTSSYYAMVTYGNSGNVTGQLATHFQTGASYVRAYNTSWSTWQRLFADDYHPNADKWTTARTLSLTGDASGSVSWDGSGNASLSVTVADDSHNHTWNNIDGASVNAWGGLRNSTSSGYIEFGPANTTYAHIYTDRPEFYFNKQLRVLGGLVYHSGNDGSGSGLDADLLDGQQGSYYYPASNPNGYTTYSNSSVDAHLNTGTATTDQVLTWTGSDYDWAEAAGGGATGGGSDKIFIENGQVVTTDYTVTATTNAMTTGPIDINAGVTVTVETGGRWVVI